MWRPYSSRPSHREYLRDQLERLYSHIDRSLITSTSDEDELHWYYRRFFDLSVPLVNAGDISEKRHDILFLRGLHCDFCTLILDRLDDRFWGESVERRYNFHRAYDVAADELSWHIH